jgi:hypothetical protein
MKAHNKESYIETKPASSFACKFIVCRSILLCLHSTVSQIMCKLQVPSPSSILVKLLQESLTRYRLRIKRSTFSLTHIAYLSLMYWCEFVCMCASTRDLLTLHGPENYFIYVHVCMHIFTHTLYVLHTHTQVDSLIRRDCVLTAF